MAPDRIAVAGRDGAHSAPLTLTRLREIIDALCRSDADIPSLAETVAVLGRHGLADLPVGKVAVLLRTVATLRASRSGTAALTPRQLESLLAEIH